MKLTLLLYFSKQCLYSLVLMCKISFECDHFFLVFFREIGEFVHDLSLIGFTVVSPSLSKLGRYVNRAGAFDRKPGKQAWNPQLLEVAIAALQHDDDRPQHYAALVHELRSIAVQHPEPLALPVPFHLGQQTAEYLLPIEEDEDDT